MLPKHLGKLKDKMGPSEKKWRKKWDCVIFDSMISRNVHNAWDDMGGKSKSLEGGTE